MCPTPALCLPLAFLIQAAPAGQAPIPAEALRTASGLAYQVIQAGQPGARPGPKDVTLVHFTGWDAEGKPFADTRAQQEAIYLNLERMMPGMRESLLAMTLGERRRVWVPEALAFAGAKGRPVGTILLDLELLDMQPAPSQAPPDVAAPGADAQVLRSGLAFKVLKPGTGKVHPRASDWITVHYSGWTTDGKPFDSSLTKGTSTSLRLRDTIDGWLEGLQLMVVGERRRFWVPQKLAYQGEAGKPVGTLVFDVELTGISGR